MLDSAWTYSPEDALGFFGTNPKTGLSEEQVKRHRQAYGTNSELEVTEEFHQLTTAQPFPKHLLRPSSL